VGEKEKGRKGEGEKGRRGEWGNVMIFVPFSCNNNFFWQSIIKRNLSHEKESSRPVVENDQCFP
jgi:hypothetical protein